MNVGELLLAAVAEENKANQACFMKLLTSIKFLARQGLPVRGDGIIVIICNYCT